MQTLTLIRHAKSSWDDPALTDFERPLNARGRRDAPEMARRLHESLRTETVPRLVSSPALRAITTAHVFADALGVARKGIRIEPSIYDASAGDLVELVRGFDAADRSILLFGHNPGLSDFARWLAPCPFSELPTCALVRLDLEIERWGDLDPQVGTMIDYRYPKETG